MKELSIKDEATIFEMGTAGVVPSDGIRSKLELARRENRPLIVKLGFDPTSPDLHLGHAVVLRKLREFQQRGHRIIVIIGEFTAVIGDPTGKNKMRPPLSREKVAENAKTYLNQLGSILDVSRVEARSNAEWFDGMSLKDMIDLLGQHTVAQILEREDFNKRYKEGIPIGLHELVYPILQGYDSYAIRADIEIGGADQLFNCLLGRPIQEAKGVEPQTVLCMPLLRGVDGHIKMSKSEGNSIGLTESPANMYGKIMSIPDTVLPEYIDLTIESPKLKKELQMKLTQDAENPMVIKKAVAFDVVRQFHGEEAATSAADSFYRQIQQKDFREEDYIRIPVGSIGVPGQPITLLDVCAAISKKSRNEIRRLVLAGAVTVNGERVDNASYRFNPLEAGTRIRIGRREYYEITN